MTDYETYITGLSPFLWARLNESFGASVLTNSAGGPDGALYGSSVLGQPGLVPDGGTSVYLPGTTADYGTFPATGTPDTEFTCIATINLDADALTGSMIAMGDQGAGTRAGWMFRWDEPTGELKLVWYRGGWWTRASVGLGDIRGIPTQVAVVASWTGLYIDFYKNGVKITPTAVPVSYEPSGAYYNEPIYIGATDFNTSRTAPLKGYEDEVLFFRTALTETQISEIHGLSPPGIGGTGGSFYSSFLRRRRR